MKLVRYGEMGREKPGIVDADGNIRDLSAHVEDIAGDVLSEAGLDKLRALDPASLPLVGGNPRIGACVGKTGKFMCIGLNYTDHAEEAKMAIPGHPMLFMKATSAIGGPNDTVYMPRAMTHGDYELELGVIIGTRCKYVSPDEALDYVAGYCVSDDVTERNFQLNLSGQWTKGKSCDTFGPIGPWLVTKDEIEDVQNLDMWLDVNGERRQTGNTRTMIFTVAECVSHLSQLMTLYPGDVISTGTPPGVALKDGMDGTGFLKVGDRVDVWIEGLGQQTHVIAKDD